MTTSVIPPLVVVAVPLTFGSGAASLSRMMLVSLLVVTVDSIFLVTSPATGSTRLTLPVATSCSTDLVSLSWKDAVLVAFINRVFHQKMTVVDMDNYF